MAKNSSQVRAQNKKTLVKRIRSRWQLYLLLLLPLAWLIIFAYVPMGGLVIAFKKYNVRQGIWGSEWVGLKNFEKFFKSVKFPVVMRNTLTISLYSLVVTFPIPIIFALLLNAMPGRRYKKVIQTVTYIPYFISTVVMVGLISRFWIIVMVFWEAYFHYLPEKQPQIFLQMENCSSTFMCGQQFGRLPDIVQLFI